MLLWFTTLVLDLGGTVLLDRLFGKAGPKIAGAFIDTAFIYWAKLTFREYQPAES